MTKGSNLQILAGLLAERTERRPPAQERFEILASAPRAESLKRTKPARRVQGGPGQAYRSRVQTVRHFKMPKDRPRQRQRRDGPLTATDNLGLPRLPSTRIALQQQRHRR